MKQSFFMIALLGCLCATAFTLRIKQQQQQSSDNSESLVTQLLLANTVVDRINLLDKDSDFIFDFSNPPSNMTTTQGEGGQIVVANRAIFPALVGNGISMAIGSIGPCGMNTPHTHPRATEIFYSVNGSFLTGFIQENGARQVQNTLKSGQAAVFPQGSIHYQANLDCETVLFVAALSSEDPGTSTVAQNFFGIDEGILSATLGGVDSNNLENIKNNIPANVALGLDQCQQKCGLGKYAKSNNEETEYNSKGDGNNYNKYNKSGRRNRHQSQSNYGSY